MTRKKSTKTVTPLTRIEGLLSDAGDQLSSMQRTVEKNVRELLHSAEASVSKAKDFISLIPSFEIRRVAPKARRTVAKSRAKRPARIRRPSAVHA